MAVYNFVHGDGGLGSHQEGEATIFAGKGDQESEARIFAGEWGSGVTL